MAPRAKKQKLSIDVDNSIVIFYARSLQPDVSLKVFDQEFHVHSMILKIHSAFFARFLDSPDKEYVSTCTGIIKYRWVTKVDGEDEWHLVADNEKNLPLNTDTYRGETNFDALTFKQILCAMYSKDYTVDSLDELKRLVDMADYYCCLPIISQSLDGVMLRSEFFQGDKISQEDITFLQLGAKLRNKKLFTEALIYVAGYWGIWPRYYETYVEDEELKRVVGNAHNAIAAKVARILEVIHYKKNKISSKVKDEEGNKKGIEEFDLPNYLRLLYEQNKVELGEKEVTESLNNLLENILGSNLVLNTKGWRSGEGDFTDHLFSAEISDEELPWDVSERDW